MGGRGGARRRRPLGGEGAFPPKTNRSGQIWTGAAPKVRPGELFSLKKITSSTRVRVWEGGRGGREGPKTGWNRARKAFATMEAERHQRTGQNSFLSFISDFLGNRLRRGRLAALRGPAVAWDSLGLPRAFRARFRPLSHPPAPETNPPEAPGTVRVFAREKRVGFCVDTCAVHASLSEWHAVAIHFKAG